MASVRAQLLSSSISSNPHQPSPGEGEEEGQNDISVYLKNKFMVII